MLIMNAVIVFLVILTDIFVVWLIGAIISVAFRGGASRGFFYDNIVNNTLRWGGTLKGRHAQHHAH